MEGRSFKEFPPLVMQREVKLHVVVSEAGGREFECLELEERNFMNFPPLVMQPEAKLHVVMLGVGGRE
jgi:hypothetical protein